MHSSGIVSRRECGVVTLSSHLHCRAGGVAAADSAPFTTCSCASNCAASAAGHTAADLVGAFAEKEEGAMQTVSERLRPGSAVEAATAAAAAAARPALGTSTCNGCGLCAWLLLWMRGA